MFRWLTEGWREYQAHRKYKDKPFTATVEGGRVGRFYPRSRVGLMLLCNELGRTGIVVGQRAIKLSECDDREHFMYWWKYLSCGEKIQWEDGTEYKPPR